MRRTRNAKIVATLGPASTDPAMIRRLFMAGVDVFRLNFSHGKPEDHRARFETLRALEQETGRPIAILADLQGPKLRVGTFANGPVQLDVGQAFRLDLDRAPGTAQRVQMPHPEIFKALQPGAELLLDDGRLRLLVTNCDATYCETRVVVGGKLSERKGVNVPGVLLPITALTEKDRRDLDFALELGVDWVALSFVQRPEDVEEARALIQGRAGIVSKLEKPSAIDRLDDIVALSDAVMVARGDLGVELPAERVPAIQKRIVRTCRKLGKPVIVATQMLESMVDSPVPTRAEASDVATAIYDGADAVMLSAESASGKYPVEAVDIMHRVIEQVEADPQYRLQIDASHSRAQLGASVADAVCCAMRSTVALLQVPAVVCFTSGGNSSLRAARERPVAPILSLTPSLPTARRLALVWGVHSVHMEDVHDATQMEAVACAIAQRERFAVAGQSIVIIAGMPFGTAGSTNLIRVATV
ncbi:pyruvate kinase [Rhodoferax aquaticus]|uniref:Pyruvate kinase n=1 Tax=Rhodoferax aquaticus TaxID=2527691 RepID=A0A515EL09_9BURK|nr:pyruvate kinase [Rhodoferax aquaticus]QDL53347.1 pyruvate kinase [Rhodoferax aquaticus]